MEHSRILFVACLASFFVLVVFFRRSCVCGNVATQGSSKPYGEGLWRSINGPRARVCGLHAQSRIVRRRVSAHPHDASVGPQGPYRVPVQHDHPRKREAVTDPGCSFSRLTSFWSSCVGEFLLDYAVWLKGTPSRSPSATRSEPADAVQRGRHGGDPDRCPRKLSATTGGRETALRRSDRAIVFDVSVAPMTS